MRWIVAIAVCAAMGGCCRKVYVPVEREHVARVHERSAARVTDTLMVAERCTVKIMPEGCSTVTHREVQRVSVVRDTVSVRERDTVRIVQTTASEGGGSKSGRRWVWMMIGCAGGVAAIVALRKILGRLV